MSLGPTQYIFLFEGSDDPITIEARTSHWLAMERSMQPGMGSLEQVLRVCHMACKSATPFDAWVETVVDWERVAEPAADAVDPTTAPPTSTPS